MFSLGADASQKELQLNLIMKSNRAPIISLLVGHLLTKNKIQLLLQCIWNVCLYLITHSQ